MISEIQRLLDEYVAWLRQGISLQQIGEWVEITTPYLDRHNDHLQIYARRDDGGFKLTDDGYIIQDLRQSGCKLETPKREELLRQALNGFGVRLNGEALEVHASVHTFAPRKHNLVQAMLAVNDLFYLAEPMVLSLFYEDVVSWLESHEVRYTTKVKFTGRSGFDHVFDFVIPKSRQQPERVVTTINRPGKEQAEHVAFEWLDTKEVRPPASRAYALLNDQQRPVPESITDALESYSVTPVPWSRREEVAAELNA